MLETQPLRLLDAVIVCITNKVDIGSSDNQDFEMAVNDVWTPEEISLNQTFCKNETALSVGYLMVLGFQEVEQ